MRLLLLSLVLTLSACASTRTSWTYETTRIIAGSSEDVTAIFEQSRAFSAAYVRGDIDELVSIYAEDGIAAPGGRDFVRGHEALREFWQIAPGVDIQHHKMTPQELWIDGDLAYDWGYYEGTSQVPRCVAARRRRRVAPCQRHVELAVSDLGRLASSS